MGPEAGEAATLASPPPALPSLGSGVFSQLCQRPCCSHLALKTWRRSPSYLLAKVGAEG